MTMPFAKLTTTEDLINGLIRHPGYGAEYAFLVSIGKPAVPALLMAAETNPAAGIIYEALADITGQNPVPVYHRGDCYAVLACWLAWADEATSSAGGRALRN